MNSRELKQALQDLGWSQNELSRRTATHRTTMSRWIVDDRIPGPLAAYLRLALRMKDLAGALTP